MGGKRNPEAGWGRLFVVTLILPVSVIAAATLAVTSQDRENYCTSESKEKLSNIAGLDFEAVETDCDATLVKDAAMRVFVSKAGESEKTLLFRYTPVWWVPPPEITVDAQHRRIAISVAMVEDIDTQLPSWNGMRVSYDIWKPDDPRLDALRRQQR